jgi:predicted helicase
VRSYLKDWCELSRAIDIATGYFEIGVLLTLGNKGQDYFAPLLAFDDDLLANQKSGRSNFTPQFLGALRKAAAAEAANLTPEDIFHYTYAVFHSPGYWSRYAEFLKIDFPRLPLTGNMELFRALAYLGGELVALHLLESPKVNAFITRFEGQGDNSIPKKPTYKDGAVWINTTQRFQGIPAGVWNFHVGGYQVCEKWLKDRKGRMLSADDITHYQRVVVALNETIRLMAEIDRVIEAHGGWPTAFASNSAKS